MKRRLVFWIVTLWTIAAVVVVGGFLGTTVADLYSHTESLNDE